MTHWFNFDVFIGVLLGYYVLGPLMHWFFGGMRSTYGSDRKG